jgi:hypothetical protein
MALPADLHEQLERMEARLRLVPADETPPAEEVREQVRTWQEHVHEAAEAIRWADDTIERITDTAEQFADGTARIVAERDRVLGLVWQVRARAFDLMQRLNPEQAWFWTEEWQAGEREAARQIAAGELTTFATDEAFDAYLRAARPNVADL